jgi:hypothetical protein
VEELRIRAMVRAARLGLPPDTARDQAHWRERRDSAAVELAAAADWDAVLLSQTVSRCEGDDPVQQLLIEARDYCPRGHGQSHTG